MTYTERHLISFSQQHSLYADSKSALCSYSQDLFFPYFGEKRKQTKIITEHAPQKENLIIHKMISKLIRLCVRDDIFLLLNFSLTSAGCRRRRRVHFQSRCISNDRQFHGAHTFHSIIKRRPTSHSFDSLVCAGFFFGRVFFFCIKSNLLLLPIQNSLWMH